MKTFLTSVRLLAVLTVLTGFLYPAVVWTAGRLFFPDAAGGSLIYRDGHVVGSSLLAQETTSPRYFHPRPSAAGYATGPSGASNRAWTSAALAADVAARRAGFGATGVPADLVTASASGLDPHLSPEAVRVQVQRVAAARSLTAGQRVALDELIARLTEGGQFGPARVNVLRLNLAIDSAFAAP